MFDFVEQLFMRNIKNQAIIGNHYSKLNEMLARLKRDEEK